MHDVTENCMAALHGLLEGGADHGALQPFAMGCEGTPVTDWRPIRLADGALRFDSAAWRLALSWGCTRRGDSR